jgi:tetratricopeptide (TPR) repeat protein
MQKAAKTIRFLTVCSSKLEVTDPEIIVSPGGLLQHILLSFLAQSVHSQQALLKLTDSLIHFAEQALTLRDLDALQEVSQVLMSLPVDATRQIGLYYHALAINRRGRTGEAETLLKTVADNAPIRYRARAIQTLGAKHLEKGQLDEALRFQVEALRVASDKNGPCLQTMLMAHLEISHVKSDTGDHRGALTLLENLLPLIHLIGKRKPFYFYAYHNEMAIELGGLGRLDEAEAALAVAIASPFAPAYPEWTETRDELEAKRTSATPSVVAINRPPETNQSSKASADKNPKPVRIVGLIRPVSKNTSVTYFTTIAKTTAAAHNSTTQSILDRLGKSLRSRAPPALF